MQPDLAENVSLFVDIDGTLIDIASTPHDVIIPEGLPDLLARLSQRLGGAFAVLTGRSIADADSMLAPLRPAAGGVHGAEVRSTPDGEIEAKAPPLDERIVVAVRRLVEQHAGVAVEIKRASVAVHYRLAPNAGLRLAVQLNRLLQEGHDHLIIARGRKVFEIVPRHVSKGAALKSFMRQTPFRGRTPIMIGDDISDQSAFQAAVELGGQGLRVAGEQFSRDVADFTGPAHVRLWLANLAGRPAA